EDFRRNNADRQNTPSAFTGVAADSEIEFCLATTDPNGNPTNGITRTFTNSTSFSANDAMKFQSSGGKDAWPTGQYLNMWVCNLGGGLLGYAQFPGSGSASTDGVVVGYNYFGNTGAVSAPFNKGRTTTHEVGHWLNLRHIWGDANCGNDFVSDTPTQQSDNSGCPNHPLPSCGNSGDMFMNYMDYTNDACMNLFTEGQKDRMRAVVGPGGFRSSLLSSLGCGGAPPPTGYCVSKGQNSSYEWIENVKVSNLSNISGNDNGYGDYTNIGVNFSPGTSYPLSLTPGFSGQAYNEYWRIWIDFNADDDFDDAGELVWDQGGMSSGTVSSTLNIPSNAPAGETRMRVQMKYNGSGTA
ncbi:MAG: zinc metalloprotease, partial [Bacteroidota bacterium]